MLYFPEIPQAPATGAPRRLDVDDGIVGRESPANIALLQKIWDEYVEMPGLRLTVAQAQRLWSLNAETCTALLGDLVALGFLFRTPDGKYGRLNEPDAPRTSLRQAG
jgi:hypothetical protein